MKLLFGGDLYVADRYRGRRLFDPSITALFSQADLRVVNLEVPITEAKAAHRILKTGPHLRSARDTILPVLTELGVDLVTLANNHIMDFGGRGLTDTLESLAAANIRAVGAGPDIEEAAAPFLCEKDGARVAILNFCENEWASAERGKAGANPLDVIENVRQIREAGKAAEFVIVVIHGGMEDFHFPTPRMVRQYRFYAENGASVIVGHHPHCVGGYEVHKGTPIFYSLGNFLFTLPYIYDSWYKSLVLGLGLQPGRSVSWDLIPIAQAKQDFALTVLAAEARESVRGEVEAYSRTIADDEALGRAWQAFLAVNGRRYLNTFNPLNAVWGWPLRAVLFRLRLDRLFRANRQYAEILNTMRCETHAEAAQHVIGRLLE